MWIKKILSVLMATICLCTGLCVTAYAEETDIYRSEDISLAYEIAQNPKSILSINGTNATCQSSTKGDDCVSITVTHTLEKYSGWFWIWDDVDGSTYDRTVNANTIMLSTTQGGLKSGTYRLRSTFSLTDSSGETENITIYSDERSVS